MSSNEKSLLSQVVFGKLEYFYANGKSEVGNDGFLYLSNCNITDDMMNEIIKEWFIEKKLVEKIKSLE